MKVHNPATGGVIADVATDGAKAVRAKYDRARAAQLDGGPILRDFLETARARKER